MSEICRSEPGDLGRFSGSFQDDRLDEMLLRYRARNWPVTLNDAERAYWDNYRTERWQKDAMLERVEKEVQSLLADPENNQEVIKSLGVYLQHLKQGMTSRG